MEATAHTILVKTHENIRQKGWWDGTDGPTAIPGTQCLGNGLGMAARELNVRYKEVRLGHYVGTHPAYDKALATIGDLIEGNGPDILTRIYDWNDKEGRTKEEVLEVLQKAIAKTATFNFDEIEVLEDERKTEIV